MEVFANEHPTCGYSSQLLNNRIVIVPCSIPAAWKIKTLAATAREWVIIRLPPLTWWSGLEVHQHLPARSIGSID